MYNISFAMEVIYNSKTRWISFYSQCLLIFNLWVYLLFRLIHRKHYYYYLTWKDSRILLSRTIFARHYIYIYWYCIYIIYIYREREYTEIVTIDPDVLLNFCCSAIFFMSCFHLKYSWTFGFWNITRTSLWNMHIQQSNMQQCQKVGRSRAA